MTAPKEVKEMRDALVEARRAARGVKESWRNLRAAPKSERFAAIVDPELSLYDSLHPPEYKDDTTTRIGDRHR